MIFGIGTDIVSVARIAGSLERHGRRFAERILTAAELVEFDASARPAHLLAKRFAAKEAAAKALGTGFSDGLSLHHIEVTHDSRGRPLLQFTGRGRELLDQFGIAEGFVSVSDEREFAVAFVTLTRRA